MKKIKVGDLMLGDIPRVVAIIDEPLPSDVISKLLDRGADLFEIRADLFRMNFTAVISYLKKLRSVVDLPLIGTVRETKANSGKRLDMYRQIIPYVDCVDVEIDAKISGSVIKSAKDKTIIVSEHNYKETPKTAQLGKIVDRAMEMGARIVKIAVTAAGSEDLIRLLKFTHARKEPLVTISMGEAGAVSRVIAPLFGSLFTYGYVTRPVAPGQISLEGLVEQMRMLYPIYDRKFDQFAQ